jgi:hypothetical protein
MLPSPLSLAFVGSLAIAWNWVSLATAQPPLSSATTQTSLQEFSPSQPQTVYVAASRAEIFSGPSTEYYPTGRVTRGAALEAYHRTADGWLGIRPPEGSFSWVPASDAYLLPGGRVIEITSQHAVSWIGSSLGSAKQYRWQVELQAGEQLAVVGEMTTQSEEGREALWYKIAPPAGEFRWIQEQAISLKAVAPASSQVEVRASPVQVAGHRRQPEEKNDENDKAVRSAGFNEDVFAGGPVIYDSGSNIGEGEIIYEDGTTIDGYYDESYHDGSYVEGGYGDPGYGGVIGNVYGPSGIPRTGSGWDGWHAMELTDEGFRIPFLERRYQQAQANRMIDPRNHDPFSLSMPGKIVEPTSMRQQVRQDVGVAPERRFTPWRDPRELRSRRMQGGLSSPLSYEASPDRSAEGLADRSQNNPTDNSQDNSAEGRAGRLAGREPAAGAPPTAAEELLGRLVSAVRNSPSSPTAPAAIANAASGRLGDEALAATSNTDARPNNNTNSKAADNTTWYGVSGQLAQSSAAGLNALELGQLQLVLSEMVAQPMPVWNLSPLMERAQHFIEHGASAVERGQARLMLERMEAFDQLAKKSGFGGGFGSVMTASASVGAGLNAGGGIATAAYESAMNPGAANQTGYDATGWLVPVHTATSGQPTHAITNDAGQVIAYVTGLPGMNLDVYLNQPVGITGLRGFLPQLQAQHVQAQRVVRLR